MHTTRFWRQFWNDCKRSKENDDNTFQEELFPEEDIEGCSPKLEWMERHGIRTAEVEPPECQDEWWEAWIDRDGEVMEGETEDEALYMLAMANGIPLWQEEAWLNQTTRDIPESKEPSVFPSLIKASKAL